MLKPIVPEVVVFPEKTGELFLVSTTDAPESV
jgi:hypothetical protein